MGLCPTGGGRHRDLGLASGECMWALARLVSPLWCFGWTEGSPFDAADISLTGS